MLTNAEIDTLIKRIVSVFYPERIILFGSYAKATATRTSDLDLLIVKETVLPMGRRADNLASIVSSYLITIDIHIYTPEEVAEYGKEPYSFIHSVLKTGKVLYEK
jgi:uncharacterized protein